jgi:site-specific DNA-methyltransferase (adenine-specific)
LDIKLIQGDSLEALKSLKENSIDSVVTDPPYGIAFLNSHWDYNIPSVELWQEVYRVLKPGGHALIFCGTRTQHRMVVNIEDAGFEIRDVITWLYGQGFPKSYNVANGIEGLLTNGSSNTKDYKKLKGTRKSKEGTFGIPAMTFKHGARPADYSKDGEDYVTDVEYSTEEALQWSGWGTALKPACEFITLVRKPLSEKTVVKNVLKWGTGAINIDATRIELNGEIIPINKLEDWSGFGQLDRPAYIPTENTKGRWPANLILDKEAGELLDEQTGDLGVSSGGNSTAINSIFGLGSDPEKLGKPSGFGDSGGASRFFYCAKPSKKAKGLFNDHPTVKPISLMKYLVKLVTPVHGICLDPFLGSGTTALACLELDFNCVGIEREEKYIEISKKRLGL